MPTWVRWLWLTIAGLLGLWLVWQLAEIVLLLALALVLTSALLPVVERLCARGMSRGMAVGACILALFGLLALFVAVVAPVVVQQFNQIADAIPGLGARMTWLEDAWDRLHARYPLVPEFGAAFSWATGALGGSVEFALGFTSRFLILLLGAFTALFLTFFFLRDGGRLLDDLLHLVPAGRRQGTKDVVARIGGRVGMYVLGQMTVMGMIGTLAAIGLWAVDIPYAATLGLLVAVLDIVPYFGPFVAAAPGIALGFSLSWWQGASAALIYLVVQQVEGFLLTPTVTGRAVGLHPVWIMLSLLVGASLLGLPGMVLAVPAAVTVQILLEELVVPRVGTEVIEMPAGHLIVTPLMAEQADRTSGEEPRV